MTERPEHLPHYNICQNCFGHVWKVHNREKVRKSGGACWHVAMFRRGFIKYDDQGNVLERRAGTSRVRPSLQEMAQAFEDGFHWEAIIDIRPRPSNCDHHNPVLAHAPKILEYYGDSIEPYREFNPDYLNEWFDAGAPSEEVQLEPLARSHIDKTPTKVRRLPEEIVAQHNSCNSCMHFKPLIDDTDRPVPYKGLCMMNASEGSILNSDVEVTQGRPTYNFLSCIYYKADARVVGDILPRSERLFIFADVNPFDMPLDTITNQITWADTILVRNPLTEEELTALSNMDLYAMLDDRVAEVDMARFNKDFQILPVAKHFALSIKANTKEAQKFWSKFDHYPALSTDFYRDGKPEDKQVTETNG